VWVFINHQLVIDLGGVHSAQTGMVKLDEVSAKYAEFGDFFVGKLRQYGLFYCGRHCLCPSTSSFKMKLSWLRVQSACDGWDDGQLILVFDSGLLLVLEVTDVVVVQVDIDE
jgi:fibro-slime domain-containing protein